ncbi:hypothetical protein P261_01598 [Lachnospiraceae bacterium TWA4]|nr:hypothetical protein P261_01598 [Lachnospiraceae bacterium TWA4]
MRFFDCKSKEVINVKDCKRLGYVSDIDFCPERGEIQSFIVPGPPKYLGCIGREKDYVIPFSCVKQIGPDLILVDIEVDKNPKKEATDR